MDNGQNPAVTSGAILCCRAQVYLPLPVRLSLYIYTCIIPNKLSLLVRTAKKVAESMEEEETRRFAETIREEVGK